MINSTTKSSLVEKLPKHLNRNVFLGLYSCGFLLVLLIIFLAPTTLVWDERPYLRLVPILERHGFSLEFLNNYPGPTFPLHTIVHYTAKPLTQLEAPGVRLISFAFAYMAIIVLGVSAHRSGISQSYLRSNSVITAPNFWAVSGLAITQAPAMLFFAGCVSLLMITARLSKVLEDKDKNTLILAAGLLLSLASFGRQTYLSILPAILVMYFGQIISIRNVITFLFASLVFVLPLILYWDGYIPPALSDSEQKGLEMGINFKHGSLAFAYAGVISFILSPNWILSSLNNARTLCIAISVVSIVIASNLYFDIINHIPMKPMMSSLFDSDQLILATIVTSNLLVTSAVLFLLSTLIQIARYFDDVAYIFLSTSLILLLTHTVVLKNNFSSSYVAMSLPLFVLIAMWHKTWSRLEFVTGLFGIIVGSTLLSFNLGLI